MLKRIMLHERVHLLVALLGLIFVLVVAVFAAALAH